MKTYDSIKLYLQECKVNDIIVFHGNELLSHIPTYKYDTYKVVSVEPFRFRNYRGRSNLMTNNTSQRISVLTKKEFNLLLI